MIRQHNFSTHTFIPMRTIALILILGWFAGACTSRIDYESAEKIAVRWELVSNMTGNPGEFEARFTIVNHSAFRLHDDNWTLFFNIAPRPILPNPSPQPAVVEHINGDWYKLKPEPGFLLAPGDSIEIRYLGSSPVIKETDAPLGLYFVFYDRGSEKHIAVVSDYRIHPFDRPEQMNRGAADREPVPDADFLYRRNLGLRELPDAGVPLVLPSPVKVTGRSGQLDITEALPIAYQPGLENEAGFLAAKIKAISGADFPLQAGAATGKALTLKLGNVVIAGRDAEAYTLEIDTKGVTITGSDPAGVFYGIQSLLALLPLEAYKHPGEPVSLSHMRIEDAPRFAFRSLHLDVSRNFQTAETVRRVLDIMAFYKLNHFLFYTTEDEGWRVEIDGLPELTSVGAQRQHVDGMESPALHPAYGSGPVAYAEDTHGSGYYTRQEFIDILRYARERHIKVIPVLNFPGHARAAIKAMEARYNRLMEEGKEAEAEEYRLIDPDDRSVYLSAQAYKDNVVSVARESTYRFYEKVVDELANMYAEAGLVLDIFHTGGDEVPEGAWTASPEAAELLKTLPEISDPKNLQAYFFGELLKRLEQRNLRVDGWEEVALLKDEAGRYVPNPDFAGRSVVAYIWNNVFDYDLGYRLANSGYPVVLCNVSNFYFDLAYTKDPVEPGLYWGGFVDVRDAWTFAPYDYFKTTFKTPMGRPIDMEKEFKDLERLKPEARKNILGLEAQLWGETLKGRAMLEYYLLPKLAGFAESAWAPERAWEKIENRTAREAAMAEGWNAFANALGRRELPRLSYLNRGYNYRVPHPGARIENGMLMANAEYPGLEIRYTTDGSEPQRISTLYAGPVAVDGTVMLRCFDAAGKASRSTVVGSN